MKLANILGANTKIKTFCKSKKNLSLTQDKYCLSLGNVLKNYYFPSLRVVLSLKKKKLKY